MEQMFDVLESLRLEPIALVDIALTAVLIYGVFSLIQGTRAVRLVIGAIILYLMYVLAQELHLVLLSGIMQTGAVVGLLALVVIFQPELRRGLDRLGRMGSLGWLDPADEQGYRRVAGILSSSAAVLAKNRVGALIVVERDTGLGDMAETGVRIDGELSGDLLVAIFAPGYPLHDGAVIVRGDRIVAAGVMLPLAQRLSGEERYGTRHRAAVGATEQTDALAIVVSEETRAVSLAEGGTITGDLDEAELRQRLYRLLSPRDVAGRARSMAARAGREVAQPEAPASAEVAPDEPSPPAGGAAASTPVAPTSGGPVSGASSDASHRARSASSPE